MVKTLGNKYPQVHMLKVTQTLNAHLNGQNPKITKP